MNCQSYLRVSVRKETKAILGKKVHRFNFALERYMRECPNNRSTSGGVESIYLSIHTSTINSVKAVTMKTE